MALGRKISHKRQNIGIDAWQVAIELKKLCDDVDAWIEYQSYPAEEIATRFHHRLVYIHAFSNGNGRHARLATDMLLIRQLDLPRFSWGRGIIDTPGEIRSCYIDALRTADKGDFMPLLDFINS